MDFGLGLLGYHGCWDDAAFAEEHGFATAGFVDSPLLAGDPFVCMALAARLTSRIRLGPFLGVPSNRSAATMATAIGTINRLAPGRAFVGIGTGYTSRNTFGLPPVPAAGLAAYAQQVRSLLDGEEITHVEANRTRPVRRLHDGDRYVDAGPEIPLYVAADGPKALRAAGSSADGWVTTLQFAAVMTNAAEVFRSSLQALRAAAAEQGRSFTAPYTIWSTAMCVLEPGERPTDERVLERVGAHAMMPFHSYADNPAIGDFLPPIMAERIEVYEREVLARFDPERRHQETHRGHLSHLLPGEASVLTDDIVRATCLVGTADEIVEVLQELAAAGLRNLSLWTPPELTREAIVEVAERIAPRLAASPPAVV